MRNYLLLILLLAAPYLNAQTYKYRIVVKGKEIGGITVNKTIKDSAIYYDIEAHSSVKVLFTESIRYHLSSIYIRGNMFYSSATIYLNGKVHFNSVVQKENAYYSVNIKGHETRFLDIVSYSGAMLYFTEPTTINKIYSEIDNVEKDISVIKYNQYKIVNPKTGNASIFYYKDGILNAADIDHTYVSFRIERIY